MSLRLTSVLLLVMLAGCPAVDQKELNFTREKPLQQDLIGVWTPTSETKKEIQEKGQYPDAKSGIILRSDGTFSIWNIPDWWSGGSGISHHSFISQEGKWDLTEDKDVWKIWTIRLRTPVNSRSINLYSQAPPYQIFLRVGDPNQGDAMLFERSAPGNATWPWPNLGHRDAIRLNDTYYLACDQCRIESAHLYTSKSGSPTSDGIDGSFSEEVYLIEDSEVKIRAGDFSRIASLEPAAKSLTFLDEVAGPYHVTLSMLKADPDFIGGAWLREANNTHSYLLPQGTFTDTGIYLTVRDHDRTTAIKILKRLLTEADVKLEGMEKPLRVNQTEMSGSIDSFFTEVSGER